MTRIFKLLEPLDIDRTRASTAIAGKRLRTAMGELRDYIEGQSAPLVNYDLRHRLGHVIGTLTTEGLAMQMHAFSGNCAVGIKIPRQRQSRYKFRRLINSLRYVLIRALTLGK